MHALGDPSPEGDFLAEARAAVSNRGPRCAVSILADSLTGATREQFLASIADPDIPSTAIAIAAQRRGWRLNNQTVQRHRRGLCLCPATTS